MADHPPPLCQAKDPTPPWHSPDKSQYEVEHESGNDDVAKDDGNGDGLANILLTYLPVPPPPPLTATLTSAAPTIRTTTPTTLPAAV